MIGLGNVSKPAANTNNIFALLIADVLLVLHLSLTWPVSASLPSIVLPLRPFNSGRLDELYPSKENGRVVLIHTILFFAQLVYVFSLLFFLLAGLPAIFFFSYILAFVVANRYICQWLLNGPPNHIYFSGKEFAKNPDDYGGDWESKDPKHEGEKWVFVNGVAVGDHWMYSNLTRLSKTFRRPIMGIHNPTFGVIFDILECIVQRAFDYPTSDIRNAFKKISALLVDDKIKKLVLVSHSQGCIEVAMVLDWLEAAMAAEQLNKLEVYTFGNAANHWTCAVTDKGPLIKHVEHYANGGDWVARLGIFQFRRDHRGNAGDRTPARTNGSHKTRTEEPEKDDSGGYRFGGRMFQRVGELGHQLNLHYLDNFFVMDEKLETVLDLDDIDSNPARVVRYMEKEVDQEMLKRNDNVVPLYNDPGQERALKQGKNQPSKLKVKDLSRLWQYRNGGTP